MKIRYRVAAIASAVALASAAGLAGAGSASAVTEFPWCGSNFFFCLLSNGSGSPVGLVAYPDGSQAPTNFASENGVQTNGHDYVQYYQIGTNRCLTDSGANVYLQTCAAKGADTRQMWWFDASPGYVVNDYATVHYGHDDCMSVNNSSGDAVIVDGCNNGMQLQDWAQKLP
jgi:hypothetical protein